MNQYFLDFFALDVLEIIVQGFLFQVKKAENLLNFWNSERLFFVRIRKTFKLQDLLNLFNGIISWQQGPSRIQFINKATNTPHVGLSVVIMTAKKYLRGSVPPCGNEFS